MSTKHCSGSIQALYRVFVQPSLSSRGRRCLSRPALSEIRTSRALSHTTIRYASSRDARHRGPETRREKWDDEITARIFYLVDPQNGEITDEPRTRYDVIRQVDRTTHRLVQIPGAEREGLPVCKIVSKKEEYEREKRLKQDAKGKKKAEAASKSTKTLELNWAVDQNDLRHRLDKMSEFLIEGRKVEIVLASKKKGRKATAPECQDVLKRIRETVDGVPGAKETKSMEGKLGGFATLFFHGIAQQSQST